MIYGKYEVRGVTGVRGVRGEKSKRGERSEKSERVRVRGWCYLGTAQHKRSGDYLLSSLLPPCYF